MGVTQAARELGIDPSTLHRWRREEPERFKQAEKPEELRRARLAAALDATHADGRPDHGVRLKAAEQLAALDATEGRGAGSGRMTIVLAEPEHEWQADRCPNCDAILGNRVAGGI
jgi:transposase-like protein